jgi:hypothetical protein
VLVDNRAVQHWLDVMTALFPIDGGSAADRKPTDSVLVDIQRNYENRSLEIDRTALGAKPYRFGLKAPDEPSIWVASRLGDAFTRSLSDVAQTIDRRLRFVASRGDTGFDQLAYLRLLCRWLPGFGLGFSRREPCQHSRHCE